MDEIEEIKRRKLEKLLQRASGHRPQESYPSSPLHVNEATLEEVVQRYPLVLVDFYADWCQPCRMLAPVIDELAAELRGKVVFAKLNVDLNPGAAMRYQALSIPTLVLFKEGRAVDRVVGALPKQALLARLRRFMG
ncbi:MAG: thioredoxin [Euryarchaeota archaeon]|nr:thioredoxin [Euryarchaeota archaeon]